MFIGRRRTQGRANHEERVPVEVKPRHMVIPYHPPPEIRRPLQVPPARDYRYLSYRSPASITRISVATHLLLPNVCSKQFLTNPEASHGAGCARHSLLAGVHHAVLRVGCSGHHICVADISDDFLTVSLVLIGDRFSAPSAYLHSTLTQGTGSVGTYE